MTDAVSSTLTRRERLRRVVIVCEEFARNLAYFHAGKDEAFARLLTSSHPHSSFWSQANANFLDVAVLAWCKLFGDRREEQCWAKVVTDPPAFETALLARLNVTAEQFESLIKEMRQYRDKFIAHLDSDKVMRIPMLDKAEAAISFYHEHVVTNEAAAGDLAGRCSTADAMAKGYAQCRNEACEIFGQEA